MAATPRGRKGLTDVNRLAFDVVSRLTGETTSNPSSDAARALSKLGAAKGGKARAANLTAARRSAIAKKAAKTRWKRAPKS